MHWLRVKVKFCGTASCRNVIGNASGSRLCWKVFPSGEMCKFEKVASFLAKVVKWKTDKNDNVFKYAFEYEVISLKWIGLFRH